MPRWSSADMLGHSLDTPKVMLPKNMMRGRQDGAFGSEDVSRRGSIAKRVEAMVPLSQQKAVPSKATSLVPDGATITCHGALGTTRQRLKWGRANVCSVTNVKR